MIHFHFNETVLSDCSKKREIMAMLKVRPHSPSEVCVRHVGVTHRRDIFSEGHQFSIYEANIIFLTYLEEVLSEKKC